MANLEIWEGNERHLYPIGDDRFRVGRDDDCHLRLDDPLVSRQHAAFFREGNRYYVEDLGSTNGTCVADVAVRPWAPVPLDHGTPVNLGGAVTVTLLLTSEERPKDTGATWPGKAPPKLRLTPAEAEVLDLLFLNYRSEQAIPQIATVEEIASARNSSTAAVKQVLQGLYNKFELDGPDRTKDTLARRAIESGVRPPRP